MDPEIKFIHCLSSSLLSFIFIKNGFMNDPERLIVSEDKL